MFFLYMSKKYIYWKWGNGGIMEKSARTKNIDMKNKDSEDPVQFVLEVL